MVNGSRYYRALERVSIASALPTALTIYPCQIRVHQRWQSKLQLPRARKKEWGRPQRTVYPRRLPVNTVIHTTLIGLEPTTFRLLVGRATSATDPLWSLGNKTLKARIGMMTCLDSLQWNLDSSLSTGDKASFHAVEVQGLSLSVSKLCRQQRKITAMILGPWRVFNWWLNVTNVTTVNAASYM